MSQKKTVPLSQIVDYATNEMQPSPNLKTFATLSGIVKSIPDAKMALRIQIVNKMKSYCNGFLHKKEMYYTLCLTDYLVKQAKDFRPQVVNSDFLQLFERAAELDKLKTTGFKPSLVNEKAIKIILTWGQLYPDELCEYTVLRDKYLTGESLPVFGNGEYSPTNELSVEKKNDTIEQKIQSSSAELKECSKLITETIEKDVGSIQIQSLKALYKRAVLLNSQFNTLLVTLSNTSNDVELLQKYTQVENEFTSMLSKLINTVKLPSETSLYRTYTTGHLVEGEDEQETHYKTNNKESSIFNDTTPINPQDVQQLELKRTAKKSEPLKLTILEQPETCDDLTEKCVVQLKADADLSDSGSVNEKNTLLKKRGASKHMPRVSKDV
ncbi:hypothetical protein EIN_375960 [Entamoeba invadens IP1]|uniref:VHS domain-containing protein n=1 Tax=Entamoeba invadens IP1 TaxID=370355 RepID=A0A0A1TY78_ENTIV|nr:hypothetical protein EIN_375960 [Entamoeba invadens IP1]ELP83461.1 hypothetical protein EIN_375960 [Entamoeba invadens IP1]|eukprot:XP_004182807.1 hypothetical protein EIN_375960 [Entamoeba invadens IP1]